QTLVQGIQWLYQMAGVQGMHQGLTVAGAAQAGRVLKKTDAVLLPVELLRVNRAASTNSANSNFSRAVRRKSDANPRIPASDSG
ncbi:MAG: hypothetical protein RR100_00205, partial [Comamonas sp.]